MSKHQGELTSLSFCLVININCQENFICPLPSLTDLGLLLRYFTPMLRKRNKKGGTKDKVYKSVLKSNKNNNNKGLTIPT